jgi:predicted nucleotide-binding protein
VCDVAVFLVTKDDILIQTSGNVADSPRDNIIFEIGYFAARLGIKYTLLVVEAGAKTPSDWGGLLHIPLHDRNNLADVNLKLYDTLKDRLRA